MSSRVYPRFPRETVEFVPFRNLGVDGVPPNPDQVRYAVVPEYARPLAFTLAQGLGDQVGFLLDGPTLGPGIFKVFIQVIATPEEPVVEAGTFRLT